MGNPSAWERVRGRRLVRGAATLVLTGLCAWYIVSKIDFATTGRVFAHTRFSLLAVAFGIMLVAIVPLTWRWQQLLAARGIHEPLRQLLRAYLIAYFLAQVLPTSLGGDAVRVLEVSRRHKRETGAIAGSVVLERVLGGAATLTLAAAGFALAIGRYDIGAYVWVEFAFVVGTAVVGVALFARSARPWLARSAPLLRLVRLERPLRAVYEGIHAYRRHVRVLAAMFLLTAFVTAFRVLAIWLSGRAVGVDLSPRPYYVMGPLLFIVMLVPFTLNGIAVRESFFVSFLTQLGVTADKAFATGFLFYLVSLLPAFPGALVLGWENLPFRSLGRSPRGGPESETP